MAQRLKPGWRPADWEPVSREIQQAIGARAEELLPRLVEILGDGAKSDRDEAEAAVLYCASGYARDLELFDTAPTSATVRLELDRMLAWMKEGEALLDSMSPLFETLGAVNPADRQALERILKELRNAVEWLDEGIVERWPSSNQKLWIFPKREFVIAALDLFDRYRPGEASTHQGGPSASNFASFVSLLHQLTTGEPAVSLDKPIRDVVLAWNRRREEISKWEQSYEGLYCELLNVKSRISELEALGPSAEPETTLAELRDREGEILKELEAKRPPGAAAAAERMAQKMRERDRT